MRRLQKYHMLDEVQEGLIKQEESSWGRNSLEVKGNFSWGFINKQDNDDSEEEEEKKKDDKVEEKEKIEDKTLRSKMTLKNMDLSIK